jgi:dTDP-4-amino-4,6-dideoxygalactose transaminase
MKPVPRFSPGFAWPEARQALGAIASGRLVRGPGPSEFARELAAYLGVRHVFLTPSARMAFWLALRATGLPPGEIIFPSLTYYAMPAAAKLAGFTPRFVDVDEHLLLDLNAVEAAINENTRAIMPVHLYGRCVDMTALAAVAARHGLPIFEDIAQALGARWGDGPVGSFGKLAIGTFGPTKNITALGGGCIVTNDDELAERLERAGQSIIPAGSLAVLRAFGFASAMALAAWPPLFRLALWPLLRLGRARGVDIITKATDDPPRDFPVDAPPAFFTGGLGHLMGRFGSASLRALDHRNARRRAGGLRLAAALEGTPGVRAPQPREGETPIFMSFPILVDDPGAFADALLARGVDTARGYMSACADLSMFGAPGDCPRSADAVARMLHLPVHPAMTDERLDGVATAVRAVAAERGGPA